VPAGRPGEERDVASVVLLLPVVVGLFLLAMERFEAWAFEPDAGAAQGPADADRTGATAGGAAPAGGGGTQDGDVDRQRRSPGIEGGGPWTYR
jgi:hypothetical protein